MTLAARPVVLSIAMITGAVVAHFMWPMSTDVHAQQARVFELRTYTVADGKVDLLNKTWTSQRLPTIFAKHGMTNVGYWIPTDEPRSKDTMIYILGHASRDAAVKSWSAFREDPAFQTLRAEEARLGLKVSKVESVFMSATQYSEIR
jgi:hypothetical protein